MGSAYMSPITGSAYMSPAMTPMATRPGSPSPFSGAATPVNASTGDLTPFSKSKEQMTFNEVSEVDDDAESMKPSKESLERPVNLLSAFTTGLAVLLIFILLGVFGIGQLVIECMYDGNWTRMALAAILPIVGLSGLFFFLVIFGDIFQILGPISNCLSNSRYYSGVAPNIRKAYQMGFDPPHITIQMPVYKEGLNAVIRPTVESLKEAISHYELNGGTASIFINDDGMQLIPEEEANARKKFYHNNNIGWVARPGHNVDGFIRAGKFKKASNMNFALNIANRTEDFINANWEKNSHVRYDDVYAEALAAVLEEDGRAWAAGNIRIGEHILIVDSDTRVPHDCLINGAAELYLNPEVAIIQHSCSVMQVVGDYFENAITWFTNNIYTAIRVSIASGEVAPFVGHNAFLRWKAIQSVAVKDESGVDKFWSESHVSEDFDIAIRLQVAGNVVRFASYHNGGFKEGVSLTVYDELARWEKYAYGCNELVFNPIYTWLYRGPFTALFRKFLWSNMQISSKITISGYIITYYAIAAAFPLTIFNYFYIGWCNNDGIDKFYLSNESWRVLISVTVVFSGLGNISLPILTYRLGEKPFFKAWVENLKWLPMFIVFFSGLSFHLSMSILAQMFGINMQWGATAKELEKSNFFLEVPKIFKRFKWMYAVCVPLVAIMIYLGCFAPHGWKITGITAILPLALTVGSHMCLPFVLNPALMIFQF